MQAQGLAGEILQDTRGPGGLAYALGKGLALLARQQFADGLATLHQQGSGPVQHIRADFGRSLRPGREGGLRSRHGGVHLGRAALGRTRHDLAHVRRVQALGRSVGGDPFAVDPVAERKGGGRHAGDP
ncbi:hypothetical protein D3C86_1663210 [compost metagenome]